MTVSRLPVHAVSSLPVIIAVPVKNEAERIANCLRALARQRDCRNQQILLLLNNCTDCTEDVVRVLAPGLGVPVHVLACKLAPETANAGHARSLAMRYAAERAGAHGVLLTTDADGRVAPDWIAANLAAIRRGADAVAGRAVIDPVEAERIPPHLHADDALECAYADRLDEIDALIDPNPADPWPRHSEESGASIAVTCTAYRRAGGVPPVALGEDRAFMAALRRVDAVIRHAPQVQVTVSGRIDGRARGGMADTMRRRMTRQDAWLDDRLEPARLHLRRMLLRAAFRAALHQTICLPALAHHLRVPLPLLAESLALASFGAGWAKLEACSPALRRHGVRRLHLARETGVAENILACLRRCGPSLPRATIDIGVAA